MEANINATDTGINTISAKQLDEWVSRARHGERLVYYSGLFLMTARKSDPELDALATMAWKLSEKGLIALVQQRLGDDRFEYVAVRVKPARERG